MGDGSNSNDVSNQSLLFDHISDRASITKLLHLMEILSLDLYLSTFHPMILSCAVFSLYLEGCSTPPKSFLQNPLLRNIFRNIGGKISTTSTNSQDDELKIIELLEKPVKYIKEAGYIKKLFDRIRDSKREKYDATDCLAGKMRYSKHLRPEIATIILAQR